MRLVGVFWLIPIGSTEVCSARQEGIAEILNAPGYIQETLVGFHAQVFQALRKLPHAPRLQETS